MGDDREGMHEYCQRQILEAERQVRAAEDALDEQRHHLEWLRSLGSVEAVADGERLLAILSDNRQVCRENLHLWGDIRSRLYPDGRGSAF